MTSQEKKVSVFYFLKTGLLENHFKVELPCCGIFANLKSYGYMIITPARERKHR